MNETRLIVRENGFFRTAGLVKMADAISPEQTWQIIPDEDSKIQPGKLIHYGSIRVREDCDYRDTNKILAKEIIFQARKLGADYVLWDPSLVIGGEDLGDSLDNDSNNWRMQTDVYLASNYEQKAKPRVKFRFNREK